MENKLIYSAPLAEIEELVSEDVVLISLVNSVKNLDDESVDFGKHESW